MMTTVEQLTQVFNDNFMAYFRSHVAHVNIIGRNFQSDHNLLGGIYEDLQGQIDTIGELLRTLYEFMPDNLQIVIDNSQISPMSINGSAIDMLTAVYDDIEHLKSCYQDLIEISGAEGFLEIQNYAQDRVLALSKHCWMLRATLD